MSNYFINNNRSLALIVFTILFIGGCAHTGSLAPAPGANRIPGKDDVVFEKMAGVMMEAQINAWTGKSEILQKVTPLKIAIENNSGKALRFSGSDFVLVSPATGESYEGLPLYAIEDPVVVKSYTPILAPAFYHNNFLIAPYYSSIYKDLAVYNGPYFYDPHYYKRYFAFWGEMGFPTQEMREKSLPEGVLKHSGRIVGFIFFEKVSSKISLVNLQAKLIDAKSGNTFGTITIPFRVKKK